MPTKSQLRAEWTKDNQRRKKEGKLILPFDTWYNEKYKTHPPSFIAQKPAKQSVDELILLKIGMEPNAWGSKRRWRFLRIMAKRVYELKSIRFDNFFVWTTAHCQCMKMRTLRDDYLDTLERLGMVKLDWNTGTISWNSESYG